RTRLLLFPPQRKAASITIPKEVAEIGPGTFSEQYWLERVVFEQGGTAPLTIGDYAFAYCYALHTVILPERLVEIGTYAFQNCNSLMQLTIPENVEKIGSFAFYYCRKLVEIYNLSALEIVAGGEENGYVGYYAYNVYTPDQGSSIVNVDANGFVTVTLTKRDALTQEMVTYKYLIGYTGDATNLVLPTDFEAFFEYAFYRQNGIVSIFVPAGAGEKAMGANVFAGSNKPVLIMGYTACPETWGTAWNSDDCPVIWGGEERETTYTFVTNSEQTLDAMSAVGAIVLPALDPVAGKVFVGWFDNAQGEGEAITGSFYSAENVTLYAIWRDKSDIGGGDGPADLTGSDFEHAIDLTLGTAQSVAVNANRKHVYLKLVPTADGEYRIYVTGGYAVLQIYAGDTLLGETVYAGFSDIIDGKITLRADQTYYFVLTTVTGKGNLRVTVEEFVEEPGPGEGGEEPGPGTGGSNPGEGEHVPVTEGGTGFADAIDINLGTIYDISLDTSGKKVYFQYTAPAA
ncbi:MAG: leucine-rich repeat protein, partial [Clostridia bacterium]|nr:leucine-rich repeat protein [Clostridia bacterium]